MTLFSLSYFAFVAVTLAVYHRASQPVRPSILLVASYGFYLSIAPAFLPVLIAITVFTHGWSALLRTRGSRPLLAIGVAVLLASLIALRTAYDVDPFARPFVAVGASFYVLQALSCLADAHNRIGGRPVSSIELAVYLAYFPKLLAGPIERVGAFCERLRGPQIVDDAALGRAISLIVLGATRKLLIAEPLRGVVPGSVFTSPETAGSAALILGLIGFAFRIYNDFAAYTDIARGTSLLFGIELSRNFRNPMFASGFSDFWNRWHITLTHWLRDYVYLPVSRALLRRDARLWNPRNLLLPPLATMLASGAWHGLNAGLLLWGAVQGLLLAGERIVLLAAGPPASLPRKAASIALLWTAGLGLLVLFRLDFGQAWELWRSLLGGGGVQPFDAFDLIALAILFLASSILDVLQVRGGELFFFGWSRPARAAALAVAVTLCFLFAHGHEVPPFIYQGF